MATITRLSDRRPHKRGIGMEYRLIVAAAFLAFLIFGIAERALAFVGLRSLVSAADRKSSIVTSAYEAANRCATYAFMG